MTNKHELVDQPSARPTNKLIAGFLSGTGLTVVLALADVTSHADFGGAWWGAGVATLAASFAAYLRKNRR